MPRCSLANPQPLFNGMSADYTANQLLFTIEPLFSTYTEHMYSKLETILLIFFSLNLLLILVHPFLTCTPPKLLREGATKARVCVYSYIPIKDFLFPILQLLRRLS